MCFSVFVAFCFIVTPVDFDMQIDPEICWVYTDTKNVCIGRHSVLCILV